jgi:MOSC domain-containing protein YiiM
MKVLSLNVSKPKVVQYRGQNITTGIYKTPVHGPHRVRATNIDGDGQADLTVHGGPDKAVYAFPSEHYVRYQKTLDHEPYDFGQFGENLTTEGLLEAEVRIVDRYRIGEAVLEVSQPRSPCLKFAIKMGTSMAVRLCLASAMTGFYFRVAREGVIEAGDAIERDFSNPDAPTVEDVHTLFYLDKDNVDGLKRASRCVALEDGWRRSFAARLKTLGVTPD